MTNAFLMEKELQNCLQALSNVVAWRCVVGSVSDGFLYCLETKGYAIKSAVEPGKHIYQITEAGKQAVSELEA